MGKELVLQDNGSAPGGLAPSRVTAEEILMRLDGGEPIAFVDARREEEWRRSDEKLPAAVRLSPEGEDETLPMIRPGQAVVTYCTCPHEASAARVAELLIARGYDDVHPLYGGMEAWRQADGPMDAK